MKNDSKKYKIGFVLDDGLDRPDGVQQNILTLGKWLTNQGHQVDYIVGETTRTDIKNVHSMAKNFRVRFNGNKLTIPTYASLVDIKKLLLDQDYDVLHVQMPYHPFCAARIVKQASPRTAVIGTFHILDNSLLVRLGTRLYGLYLHRNLKRFDKYFSVSEPARVFARTSFRIDSTVLPNPVDIEKYRPTIQSKKLESTVRIIFVGRLVPRKGCMKLVQAIDIILHKLGAVDFHLDICGDGQLRPELERYVAKHKLKNVVTFHGFISEEKKVEMLQKADIAVYPSSGGESFGIVLIEAMAAESAVVLGGNNPGYRSVLGELPESLFDPNNEKKLADKLKIFIGDQKVRQRLFAKQQVLVRKFDVAVVGKQLVEAYGDCIDRKNNG